MQAVAAAADMAAAAAAASAEAFDEHEEWALARAHYCLWWAAAADPALVPLTAAFPRLPSARSASVPAAAPLRLPAVRLRSTTVGDHEAADAAAAERGLFGHSAVSLRGSIYIFGGFLDAAGRTDRLATVSIRRTPLPAAVGGAAADASWEVLPACGGHGAAPAARVWHAAAAVRERYMVIYGGRAGPCAALGDVHVYDTATRRWHAAKPAGCAPPPRYRHALAPAGRLPNGAEVLLVFGGSSGSGGSGDDDGLRLLPAAALEISSDKYSASDDDVSLRFRWRPVLFVRPDGVATAAEPSPRVGHTLSPDGAGGILLYGGLDACGRLYGGPLRLRLLPDASGAAGGHCEEEDAPLFFEVSDTTETSEPGPPPRFGHAACVVVAAGGGGGGSGLAPCRRLFLVHGGCVSGPPAPPVQLPCSAAVGPTVGDLEREEVPEGPAAMHTPFPSLLPTQRPVSEVPAAVVQQGLDAFCPPRGPTRVSYGAAEGTAANASNSSAGGWVCSDENCDSAAIGNSFVLDLDFRTWAPAVFPQPACFNESGSRPSASGACSREWIGVRHALVPWGDSLNKCTGAKARLATEWSGSSSGVVAIGGGAGIFSFGTVFNQPLAAWCFRN